MEAKFRFETFKYRAYSNPCYFGGAIEAASSPRNIDRVRPADAGSLAQLLVERREEDLKASAKRGVDLAGERVARGDSWHWAAKARRGERMLLANLIAAKVWQSEVALKAAHGA